MKEDSLNQVPLYQNPSGDQVDLVTNPVSSSSVKSLLNKVLIMHQLQKSSKHILHEKCMSITIIVLQDTVLFFLWFSKCVFLIMWKCLCSLVKTSSCFNAINQHNDTCLFLFSGVPCLFWEGLFLLGGLRKFKPNILFTTCTWLEWPNFMTQFPIFLYLPIYTIWWLLPYQNHLHF